MLDRAKAAAPANRHGLRLVGLVTERVFMGVDRSRDDRHIFVVLASVIGQILVSGHNVGRQAANFCGLSGKF